MRLMTTLVVLVMVLVGALAQNQELSEQDAIAKYAFYRDQGYTDLAAKELQDQAKRFPDSVDIQAALAESYHLTGQRENALNAYDRALEMDPDNVVLKANRAQLMEGALPARFVNVPPINDSLPEDVRESYRAMKKFVQSLQAEIDSTESELSSLETRPWRGASVGDIESLKDKLHSRFRVYVDQSVTEADESFTKFEQRYGHLTQEISQTEKELVDARQKAEGHESWNDLEPSQEYLDEHQEQIKALQEAMNRANNEVEDWQRAVDAAVRADTNAETIMANAEKVRLWKEDYRIASEAYEKLMNPKKWQLIEEYYNEHREKIDELAAAEQAAYEEWAKAKAHWNQLQEEFGQNAEEAHEAQVVTSDKYWQWKDAEKAYEALLPSFDERVERQQESHKTAAENERRVESNETINLSKLNEELEREIKSLRGAIYQAYETSIVRFWHTYCYVTSVRIGIEVGNPYMRDLDEISSNYRAKKDTLDDLLSEGAITRADYCTRMQQLYAHFRPRELMVHHKYRARFHSLMRQFFAREQEMFDIARDVGAASARDGESTNLTADLVEGIEKWTMASARWGPTGFASLRVSELMWSSICWSGNRGPIPGLDPKWLEYRNQESDAGLVFRDYESISRRSIDQQLSHILRERFRSMPKSSKESLVRSLRSSEKGAEMLRDAILNRDGDQRRTITEILESATELKRSVSESQEILDPDELQDSALNRAFEELVTISGEHLLRVALEERIDDQELIDDVLDFIGQSYEVTDLILTISSEKELAPEELSRIMSLAKHPMAQQLPTKLVMNNTRQVLEGFDLATDALRNMENGDLSGLDARVDDFQEHYLARVFGFGKTPESASEAVGGVINEADSTNLLDFFFGKDPDD